MRSKSPRFLCELLLLPSAVLFASMAPGHADTPSTSIIHEHVNVMNVTGQAVGRVPVTVLPSVSSPSFKETLLAIGPHASEARALTSTATNWRILNSSQFAQSVPVPGRSQANPNQDRFLQQPGSGLTPIPPAELQSPTAPIAQPTQPATPSGQTVSVQRIEVTGSTILSASDIAPITKPFEGRSATLEELRGVADAITQLYLDRGFITSRAILVDQTVANGVVQIRAVEGGLERIDVEGVTRLNPDYIRSRIELAGTRPLNKDRLEDQLRLLRADPNFENVEASLRAGNEFGQSVLTVRVKEADPFDAVFSADNFSPPSVGSERLGVGLSYRNLISANGDQLAASFSRSTTGGSSLFDFSYRVVLNPMNGTVQLRYAP
ncbi:MAG: POTRA domain-containing protein, partial [Leptolyngbyaceae cyanobacterium bins.59]|nr:POTRA domain-containing protein [Leptolyngbyaceae cyanobacterium bins.59]